MEFEELLKGVKPGFHKLIMENKHLINMEIIKSQDIIPQSHRIFECFKYFEPEETKVIIIAQAPYINLEDATGLAFSTNGNLTNNLKIIYKRLAELGYKISDQGNLESWANQKVLLINKYLTRSSQEIHMFWEAFTLNIITKISELSKCLGIFLLGTPELENYLTNTNIFVYKSIGSINDYNKILESKNISIINWDIPLHKKTLEQEKIMIKERINRNTKLLNEITKKLESDKKRLLEIDKNISVNNILVMAVDGGCINNGSTNAKGSYAVHFPKYFNGIKNMDIPDISGIVPNKQIFMDNEYNITYIDTEISVTSARSELLAMIHALITIIKTWKTHNQLIPIYIIGDSTYVIYLVAFRIWKYINNNNDMKNVDKNKDMILIIKKLLLDIGKIYTNEKNIMEIWKKLVNPSSRDIETTKIYDLTWPYLTIMHQKSHLLNYEIEKLKKAGGYEYDKYLSNEKADMLCQNILKN